MKASIDNATKKVSFKVSSNSNFSVFEVGTYKMDNKKIVDNITSAVEQLKEKWPGGWLNILRLYLKPMKQSKVSIPLYYSKVNPNDVEVPVEVGVKQTRLDKINEMLSKKSKKISIDRKTKKLVKVKGETPLKKSDKKQKVKKPKTDKPAKAAVEAVEVKSDEKVKKDKKKRKISEPVAEVAEVPAEATIKKKKKKAAVAEAIEEVKASEKSDKKKKVKGEEPKKKKKKSKVL